MQSFEFIVDDDFRNSLESDYSELKICIENKLWKAAHVIAGSIIEAVLIDYLISERFVKKERALKMNLSEVLIIYKDHKIISEKIIELMSVIKSYRNLIHPGRVIRLKESVTEDGSVIAKSLIKMLISEISSKRKEKHGYTAEQIISKIESDASATVVLPHLLKETNPIEIEKLLIKILPNSYMQCMREENQETNPDVYKNCFRVIFDKSPERIKRKVANIFVKIIKEEGGFLVESYSEAFFIGLDIKYLNKKDVAVIKEYILSRLSSHSTIEVFNSIKGLGAFINKDEVNKLIDPLVRSISYSKDKSLAEKAKICLDGELSYTSRDIDVIIIKRLNEWIPFLKEKENPSAEILENLKGKIDLPAPE